MFRSSQGYDNQEAIDALTACRLGYLFRHGRCGLGYYRADKLVELDARHHDHPEGIHAAAEQASDLPGRDEQRACSPSAAELYVQAASAQQNGHQPDQVCSENPGADWTCSNMTAGQSNSQQDAAGSDNAVSAAGNQMLAAAAASAAAPGTSAEMEGSNAMQASQPAPDALQSPGQRASSFDNAANSRNQQQSSSSGSRGPSMRTQTQDKSMTIQRTSTAAPSLDFPEPVMRHPAWVMHLHGERSCQTAAKMPHLYCCCLFPEQSLVLAGSAGHTDNSFTVWSLKTGQLLQQLQGHSAPVLCLMMTKDGSLFLSGSYDKTIR